MKVYQVQRRLCTSAEHIKANTDYCDVSVVCVPNYRNGIDQENYFLHKNAEEAGKGIGYSRGDGTSELSKFISGTIRYELRWNFYPRWNIYLELLYCDGYT